jgi:choline monooxygenase
MITNPIAPNYTIETTRVLLPPGSSRNPETERSLDRLGQFWDLVNVQDVAIVERVQDGLSTSAYEGGRMCFKFEEPLHRFQNMIIDRLVGIDRIPPGDDHEDEPMFPGGLGRD